MWLVSLTMTVTGESDKEIKSMAFTPCSFLLLFRKYFFMTTSVNGKLVQIIENGNGSINATMNVNLDDYKILFVIISASAQSVIMCSNYDNTSYYGAGSSFTASGIQDCRITLVNTDVNKWRIDGAGFYSVVRIYGFK